MTLRLPLRPAPVYALKLASGLDKSETTRFCPLKPLMSKPSHRLSLSRPRHTDLKTFQEKLRPFTRFRFREAPLTICDDGWRPHVRGRICPREEARNVYELRGLKDRSLAF